MEYIKIGSIINTFGIRGELKIKSYTDFPEMRFKVGQTIYIYYQDKYVPVVVKRMREHKGFILLTFEDLENINLVEKYKNCDLYIDLQHVHTLNQGEYYFFQLKGCDVYYNNSMIGKVQAVEEGYQTILRIKVKDKEMLVPYVDRFVKGIDVEHKRIDVDIIEGML
jgi:16S rRNA processing protein RimM